jgi:two-component system response regulator AtoC
MNKSAQHKIIILDSDQNRRDYLRAIITARGLTPFIFEKESRCLDNISPLGADLVISGPLAASKAYRLINTIKSTSYGLPVMIISNDKAIADFIRTNGFEDISILKENLNSDEIQGAITARLKNDSNDQCRQDCPLLIGNNPEMVKIKTVIPELNRLNETVLIQGEPGTGKDLLARVIHFKSDRHDRPLVKIDVPGLLAVKAENGEADRQAESLAYLLENQESFFALADTGTLYLDEIGAMTAEFQAGLLHFLKKLQSRGPEPGRNSIHIIASNSSDLKTLVSGGQFRKDLYYRLNVIKIEIPPLRQRMEDIPQLADFFADRYCLQLGKSHFELSSKTKTIFSSYFWPGNVREMENMVRDIVAQGYEDSVVEKLYLLSENDRLLNNFEGFLTAGELARVKNSVEDSDDWSLKEISQEFLGKFEKRLVKKVLDSTNWNRRKAAELLDISYKSLLNKIKDYELTEVS